MIILFLHFHLCYVFDAFRVKNFQKLIEPSCAFEKERDLGDLTMCLVIAEPTATIFSMSEKQRRPPMPVKLLTCQRRDCKKPFFGKPQARYCSRMCKRGVAEERLQPLRTISIERHMSITTNSPIGRELMATILKDAPPRTIGFVLDYWDDAIGWIRFPVFPLASRQPPQIPNQLADVSRRKKRSTWDGRRVEHAFYYLVPFEIPAVPRRGVYRVRYVREEPPHEVLEQPEVHVSISFSVQCPGSPISFRP